ncbi:hypothetical protein Glove_410g105 [Diversispora epigaea]|uniref:Uncharacterized protein n=1 Tax=Diversispora epigaea TaxID=1348612 RepID=A0A397H2B3_9GLOM|nr:hypothetical protein Glove_410g105 [Diversispora epigaea]
MKKGNEEIWSRFKIQLYCRRYNESVEKFKRRFTLKLLNEELSIITRRHQHRSYIYKSLRCVLKYNKTTLNSICRSFKILGGLELLYLSLWPIFEVIKGFIPIVITDKITKICRDKGLVVKSLWKQWIISKSSKKFMDRHVHAIMGIKKWHNK